MIFFAFASRTHSPPPGLLDGARSFVSPLALLYVILPVCSWRGLELYSCLSAGLFWSIFV